MLSIGGARHPGPCTSSYPSGFSIEFLESTVHFLAIAEHRLVPARARTVTTQLRQARRSSVWAPSCQDVTPGGHAGVGVISLHGAPLSFPTLFDPSFKGFFRIGLALRVVLLLGNGGVVHMFVIYGYQGAESNPEKLQLSEHLFAVLAEAKMCSAGQPVILAGDFNAELTVIPSLAKGISDGHWVDIERAFATGRGVPPSSTCQFQLDEDKGSRRDFLLACLIAQLLLRVLFCQMAGSLTISLYMRSLLSLLGMLLSKGLRFILPFASQSHEVRDIWDVYIREFGFVPFEVRSQLSRLCNSPDVDSSWLSWSREAEASLARAYLAAGDPHLSNPGSYVGRGSLSICSMRLGGRCHDRIHHVNRADEFDVTHSGFFSEIFSCTCSAL